MADQDIQEAVREGRGLAQRLRAGELVPGYTEARDLGPCRDGKRHEHGPCKTCNGTGLVPYDPLDLVRLMAFCGHEEARGIVECAGNSEDHLRFPEPCVCGFVRYEHEVGQHQWLGDLQRLAAKLPPKRVEVEEHNQVSYVLGPRKVTHDTPAERWLLVVAAEAVGRAVWRRHECRDGAEGGYPWGGTAEDHSGCCEPVSAALDATRAWIEEPTPGRRPGSMDYSVGSDHAWFAGTVNAIRHEAPEHAVNAILAASKLIPNAREIAAAAVLERLA